MVRSSSSSSRGLTTAGGSSQGLRSRDTRTKIDTSTRTRRIRSHSSHLRCCTARYYGELVGWACELGGRRVGGVADLDVVQTLLSSCASYNLHFLGNGLLMRLS
jgi:hypothetical protein